MHLVAIVSVLSVVSSAGPSSEILPLHRVRLYETGVGYFERDGQVSGQRRTSLPLPASHVDDALKTLVVLSSSSHVTIGGIAFSSLVSEGMARALAGLPLDTESTLGYRDLLESLEGVEVEVQTQRERFVGQLVEVLGPFTPLAALSSDPEATVPGCRLLDERTGAADETGAESADCVLEAEYTLVVRSARGAIRRVRTRDLQAIRPTEAASNARIEVALAALSGRAAQSERPLKVQIEGAGPLKLGYIAETPVWRTTYRAVLAATGGKATLQAWALLHNDTDENWRDVSVELANGRPTSFLFPLAAPRYARRELAEPELELSTVPQLLNTTADRLWGDFVDGGTGSIALGGRGHGAMGMGMGYGSAGGGVATRVEGSVASNLALGDLARFAQATGEENGSLFVYKLSTPLDLDAHHSALVPVVQRQVEAEAITWFLPDEVQAMTAARLVNTTNQTLPAGTIAFFDSEGFLGESGFDRLKPAEQTFAVFGVELDVDLERHKKREREQLSAVEFRGEALVEQLVAHSNVEIHLRNRSGSPRIVYVGLPVARNATLQGHDRLDFDHLRKVALARFELPARKELSATLQVQEAEARATGIGQLSARRLGELASLKQLPAAHRELLTRAAELRRQLDSLRVAQNERSARTTTLQGELERLREDLRALGSAKVSDESTRHLSRRMVEREEEMDALTRAEAQGQREDTRLTTSLRGLLSRL